MWDGDVVAFLFFLAADRRRHAQTRAKENGALECMGGVSVNMIRLIFPEAPPPHVQCWGIAPADAVPSAPLKSLESGRSARGAKQGFGAHGKADGKKMRA